MKSFKNINKNNLYFGEKILLGTYSTDWSVYELEVEGAVQNFGNRCIAHPFWESGELNDGDLENFKKIMLDNFQELAGRELAIIKIDGYKCVCAIDSTFSKSTVYQLLLLAKQYVYPFDSERRYPIQMIETKTTWKY